ncbi:MAG: hypothetical protein U1G05_19195 [Kiritimatiellia bacterium]
MRAAFRTPTPRFFANWRAIIGEAGTRYGERLAGWWFDGSSVTFYAHGALGGAGARAASEESNRLIGFNRQVNSPTMFQDLYLGENVMSPPAAGCNCGAAGTAVIQDGPHASLQGGACLIAGSSWVHTRRDAEPAGVNERRETGRAHPYSWSTAMFDFQPGDHPGQRNFPTRRSIRSAQPRRCCRGNGNPPGGACAQIQNCIIRDS